MARVWDPEAAGDDAVAAWARRYVAAARADRYAAWADDLECHEDPAEAARVRERAMVELVSTVAVFFRVDNAGDSARVAAFLARQTYRRADSPARYVLRFFGSPLQDACLFVDELRDVDLAESHGTFCGVAVGRLDGAALGPREREALEQAVVNDFLFDHDEDDVDFRLESSAHEAIVFVRET